MTPPAAAATGRPPRASGPACLPRRAARCVRLPPAADRLAARARRRRRRATPSWSCPRSTAAARLGGAAAARGPPGGAARRRRQPRRLGAGGRRAADGGRHPGRGVGAGARRRPAASWCSTSTTRRCRRAGADLARPRRRRRAGPRGPACRACSSRRCPTLEALAVAGGCTGAACRSAAGGRSSTWSTGATRTRAGRPVLAGAGRGRCASAGRVVCVLNRLGRSRLLACAACGEWPAASGAARRVGQPEPRRAALRRVRHRAAGRVRVVRRRPVQEPARRA